jgi:hypothetical protein
MTFFMRYAWPHPLAWAMLDRCYKIEPTSAGARAAPLAWAEWALYQVSGDVTRLADRYPLLCRRMQPVQPTTFSGWSPIALAQWDKELESLLKIGRTVGASEEDERRFAAGIRDVVRAIDALWDPHSGFFYRKQVHAQSGLMDISGLWPLLMDLDAQRTDRLVKRLTSPNHFWRLHPVPSLAASHPDFAAEGSRSCHVTFQNNWAIAEGLRRAERHDVAHELAIRHLDAVAAIFRETERLWPSYAPDRPTPNFADDSADAVMLAGLSCIGQLIESAMGIGVEASANRVVWQLREAGSLGIEKLRYGNNEVDLRVVDEEGQGRIVRVQCLHEFQLEIVTPSTTYLELVPAGRHDYALTHLDRTDVDL